MSIVEERLGFLRSGLLATAADAVFHKLHHLVLCVAGHFVKGSTAGYSDAF